jgi:large subunit ribosomal protein LX
MVIPNNGQNPYKSRAYPKHVQVRIYRVIGHMRIGAQWRKFTIEVPATKPSEAIEKAYSDLGSRHRLERGLIRIEEVKEISKDEVRRTELLQLMSLESLIKW